ncbi:hypothetical protein [Candidatus Clostridium radicumherbarum]|uniref:Lipoprotein n=1 Tax=Candidatus Clostridium radicumherbarum TaxID=3381662 RepID=A0ABW8TPV7_9CLOT
MAKQVKKLYRLLAWFFSIAIAAGTLVGCVGSKYGPPATKYGPPAAKYGPPAVSDTIDKSKGNVN